MFALMENPTPMVSSSSCLALKTALRKLYTTEEFRAGGILGAGYFATVILVEHMPTSRLMALKISHDAVNLSNEISLLHRINHKNVISFYGACVVGGRLACALEFAELGSMYSVIFEKSINFTWSDRVSLIRDITLGLQYLHQNALIHRDLSSQNILLRLRNKSTVFHDSTAWPSLDFICDESITSVMPNSQVSRCASAKVISCLSAKTINTTCRCKIAAAAATCSAIASQEESANVCPFEAVVGDVGLVLDLEKRSVDLHRIEGNPFYTAPECLTGRAPYSKASDIFSLGLLVCELCTNLVNDGYLIPRLNSFALDTSALPILTGCPSGLEELIKDCSTDDQNERPSVSQVLDRLYQPVQLRETRNTGSTRCQSFAASSCCSFDDEENSLPSCCFVETINSATANGLLVTNDSLSNKKRLQFPKRFTSFSMVEGWRLTKTRLCKKQQTFTTMSSDFRGIRRYSAVDARTRTKAVEED